MPLRLLAILSAAILLLAGWLLLRSVPLDLGNAQVGTPRTNAISGVIDTVPGSTGQALLPLPPAPALPADKVALGERLFFDRRLSTDNTIACVSCHDLSKGGTDRLPASIGVGGAKGMVNAPTVFNAALHFTQFWDGRAASLEEQAAGPVHNPVEMASSWPEVIAKLSQDPDYVTAFAQVYPDQGMTGESIADAIATYERTLLTESRFDRFLRGETEALSVLEQHGYQRFLDNGCASCHQGRLLGGNMFQRFGVMDDYFANRPTTTADLGRFNVTGRDEDRHVFKVPSLRNVAITPPYFHDASARSLEEAIMTMARYQLGRDLPNDDLKAIHAFLGSLTGSWQGRPLQ